MPSLRRLSPALCAALVLWPLTACSPDQGPAGSASTAPAKGCAFQPAGEPAKPVDPPQASEARTNGQGSVVFTFGQGQVTVTTDRAAAPCAALSFESLARQQYFDGTACHRLVDSGIFVLQCGDPTGTGRGGPGYRFADELRGGETYPAGTVAMANSGPNTNGSQFFFVYQDTQLPAKYTVFGRLDPQSLGVIARIAAEGQDGSNPDGSGKPNGDAKIQTAKVGG